MKTDPDVILLAGRYTLLDHLDALPFLAACANRNVAVMVGGPFNSGILAVGSRGAGMYDYAAPDPFILERVRRIEELCEAHGVSLAAAALQFSLGQRAVISVLSGMHSRNEVMNNIRLMSEELPKAFWPTFANANSSLRTCPLLDGQVESRNINDQLGEQ